MAAYSQASNIYCTIYAGCMSQLHPVQTGTFFATTNIKNRARVFSEAAYAREAVETLYRVQERHPFFLYGFVIMPDHCHLLLRIPEEGSISKFMNVYKGVVSASLGLGPIWQPRFHVRIEPDVRRCLRHIHMNPVRAGLCDCPEDYRWSSACGQWDVCDPDMH